MATTNPFDLLGEDDIEDPSVFLAAQEKKAIAAKPVDAKPAAKLPSKPLPPTQAVREARNDTGRGVRGFGRGRGPSGPNRDFVSNANSLSNENGNSMGYKEEREKFSEKRVGGPRAGYRGGQRGGFSNGNATEGERPRRAFERRSGSGRGSEVKREGSGRGNWGSATDEIAPETVEPVAENEENVTAEKTTAGEENVDAEKEKPVTEAEEKEPEEKQMTLEEYEKVLEEKRKALMAMKVEERKVKVDKELQSMQVMVSKKKNDEEVFIKLGSDKDKRKEVAEKEERAKKSVSINEFLKPAEGETQYRSGGRGRGRGRGREEGLGERSGGRFSSYNAPAPKIEDPSQFPTLGAK